MRAVFPDWSRILAKWFFHSVNRKVTCVECIFLANHGISIVQRHLIDGCTFPISSFRSDDAGSSDFFSWVGYQLAGHPLRTFNSMCTVHKGLHLFNLLRNLF